MKKLLPFLLLLCSCSGITSQTSTISSIASSSQSSNQASITSSDESSILDDEQTMEMIVNNYSFSCRLVNNPTVTALKELLPLSITMRELNSNEKYYYLDQELPSNPQRVNQINRGDIMLFGNDCLVVFYESFTTSYSYTRIGKIDNTDTLKTALETGNISVTFR